MIILQTFRVSNTFCRRRAIVRFSDGDFKIGMTRRLEPHDRILYSDSVTKSGHRDAPIKTGTVAKSP